MKKKPQIIWKSNCLPCKVSLLWRRSDLSHHCHATLLKKPCVMTQITAAKETTVLSWENKVKAFSFCHRSFNNRCIEEPHGANICWNLLCAISRGFLIFSKIAFIYSIYFIITHNFHELVKIKKYSQQVDTALTKRIQWEL